MTPDAITALLALKFQKVYWDWIAIDDLWTRGYIEVDGGWKITELGEFVIKQLIEVYEQFDPEQL